MPEDPYAQIAKPSGQGDPYSAIAKPPAAPSTAAEPSTMSKIGQGALDLGKGAAKGALSTVANIDQASRKYLPSFMTNQYFGMGKPTDIEGEQKKAQTHGIMQGIGKGAEQVGEFMIPGGAEEAGAAKLASLVPKLGKAALPLAKIGTSALSSGLVNKAQGGEFGTGAAMGAGGQALGQGIKAAAPTIASSALGIPKAAKAFGKTPGEAIINETRGIRPETIAASAKERMGQLTPELESAASRSTTPASLTPARTAISDAATKAQTQNAAGLHGQLQGMGDTLNRRFDTGAQIPAQVSPRELLDLKRGFSDEHLRWNPETHDRALSAGRQAYGALDSELDRTVPEAAGLNQRISSLIPVAHRAESVSRNAPVMQKALGRFGAHTGALTMGGLGAGAGYKEGGLPGAVAGGVTGVLAPELIASPEGQMIAARLANKAGGLKPAIGAALQLDRKDEKK